MAVGELAPYESLPSSAVSREAAAGLGTTSQIWLGSDFCARHILRNLNDVPAPPAFWTREQTGGDDRHDPGSRWRVSPVLTASDLVAAVPGLSDLQAELRVRDSCNKPGASLGFADLYELAAAIDEALNDGCAGAVVTQGTDTIEEVAYVLDLPQPTDAPVVVTGAMRNPTMAGADGPANILAAIRVAASPCARGLGCLVALNDQVYPRPGPDQPFPLVWQVLGSNQRRLSRRFYSTLLPAPPHAI